MQNIIDLQNNLANNYQEQPGDLIKLAATLYIYKT
jgi:hypothetical protein